MHYTAICLTLLLYIQGKDRVSQALPIDPVERGQLIAETLSLLEIARGDYREWGNVGCKAKGIEALGLAESVKKRIRKVQESYNLRG